jgi:hypothetical protein
MDAARTAVADVVLHTNARSPFRLLLSMTGAEARTDLYYEYRYQPERDDSLLGFPRLGSQLQRSYVRNACGAGQHRAG